jgi:hypothetical protein|tara:strand:- start:1154 stop:1480 length:327 start_codon:yes stop_codon:yes gene_type:complete
MSDSDWHIYSNDENVFDEIWRDLLLRAQIKVAFFQKMMDEGRITYDNAMAAHVEIGEMVDNLVSVDDGDSVIFYGIDGEPGDPNNIAAQFFHEDHPDIGHTYAWEGEE